MTTKIDKHLEGKIGRIYVARKGTIMVFVLDNGETWFCNTLVAASVVHKGPVPEYWQHSIDFAGGFSTYFIFGLAYDETDRPFYPPAEPINPLTPVLIEKLKVRAGKSHE